MLSFNLYGMCSGSVGCEIRVGEADEDCCGFLFRMKKNYAYVYKCEFRAFLCVFFPISENNLYTVF